MRRDDQVQVDDSVERLFSRSADEVFLQFTPRLPQVLGRNHLKSFYFIAFLHASYQHNLIIFNEIMNYAENVFLLIHELSGNYLDATWEFSFPIWLREAFLIDIIIITLCAILRYSLSCGRKSLIEKWSQRVLWVKVSWAKNRIADHKVRYLINFYRSKIFTEKLSGSSASIATHSLCFDCNRTLRNWIVWNRTHSIQRV